MCGLNFQNSRGLHPEPPHSFRFRGAAALCSPCCSACILSPGSGAFYRGAHFLPPEPFVLGSEPVKLLSSILPGIPCVGHTHSDMPVSVDTASMSGHAFIPCLSSGRRAASILCRARVPCPFPRREVLRQSHAVLLPPALLPRRNAASMLWCSFCPPLAMQLRQHRGVMRSGA